MPEFRASDGVRLRFRDVGSGSPVVFVHGWMMSGRFFHKQYEALHDRFRCIVPDLRGCGDSEARPGTLTMARYADDLHELIEHLDLRGLTVMGWSMGGGITMQYIDRHGTNRLAGVGLVDFPPRFVEDPSVADRVCAKLATDRDAFMAGFFKRMFLQEPPVHELRWIRQENALCRSETGCEMYRQLGVGSSLGRTFSVPALLVFPANGWFPTALDDWRAIFPDHVAPSFPSSRHCPFLEEPDAFNSAVSTFVAHHVGRPS